jgi:hypothetical protein
MMRGYNDNILLIIYRRKNDGKTKMLPGYQWIIGSD